MLVRNMKSSWSWVTKILLVIGRKSGWGDNGLEFSVLSRDSSCCPSLDDNILQYRKSERREVYGSVFKPIVGLMHFSYQKHCILWFYFISELVTFIWPIDIWLIFYVTQSMYVENVVLHLHLNILCMSKFQIASISFGNR